MKIKKIWNFIIESFYLSTNYWIDPKGNQIQVNHHEDYLADTGLTYDKAFALGYIRLAMDEGEIDSIQFDINKATKPAKKTIQKLWSLNREGWAFVDIMRGKSRVASNSIDFKTYMQKYGK